MSRVELRGGGPKAPRVFIGWEGTLEELGFVGDDPHGRFKIIASMLSGLKEEELPELTFEAPRDGSSFVVP